MTSKPDSVSTLGYHWTYRTGRPLEPQVNWDATGTTLADARPQWCSSGDPVLICIIGTHWKTTGKPLEDHWKTTGISPVAFQCTLGSKFQAHWIATGRPLAQGKGLRLKSPAIGRSVLLALCEDNPPVIDGFPSQRASKEKNVSISWRHNWLPVFVFWFWFNNVWLYLAWSNHRRGITLVIVTKVWPK